MKNSIVELKNVLTKSRPSFAFLREPQLFQCDAKQTFQFVEGEYCWHLNSEDVLDPELPTISSRSHGGTVALWQRELDPHVEVVPTTTSAFLPIVLMMPGLRTSIHMAVYLPTHGKDSEFVSDLAELRNVLDELNERFTNPVIYIRGDGNVNSNNKMRVILLRQLIADYELTETDIGHTTYHHFVGNGSYDSTIDVLLHSSIDQVTETVGEILCIHDYPALLSHHDVILSTFTVPIKEQEVNLAKLVTAPKCNNTRTRIIWSTEGQVKYADLVSSYPREAREKWLDPRSQDSMSVLLSVTNNIMSKCATLTNDFKVLGTKHKTKSKKIPKIIKTANNKMIKAHKKYKIHEKSLGAKHANVLHSKASFKLTKTKYRQALRQDRLRENLERYKKLGSIFSKPSSAYSYLRSCRQSKATRIDQL